MPVATTEIRRCSMDEMLDQGKHLFVEHWQEIALNKDVMLLKLHELRYRAMEKQGALLALGGFVDSMLVGYSVNLITNHLHYADLCYCANDALFVAPEHRNTSIGVRLIRETEAVAREEGCKIMTWHAKPATTLERMLDRSPNYIVQDVIFSRKL